jgi:hypothetical protein
MLPSTLEWHAAALILILAGALWPVLLVGAAGMLALSLVVAGLQAWQVRLPPELDGFRARGVVAVLSYLQPLVRSWARYHTRLLAHRPPNADPALDGLLTGRPPLPWRGRLCVAYWSENGIDRTELVGLAIAYLNENGWGKAIDSGWSSWDVDVYCHPWTMVRVRTGQEEHGGDRRLLRVGYQLRSTGTGVMLGMLSLAQLLVAGACQGWLFLGGATVTLLLWGWIWYGGRHRANRVVAIFDLIAQRLGLIRCAPAPAPAPLHTPPAAETQRLAALTVVTAPAPETGQPQQAAALADLNAAKLAGPPWMGRPAMHNRTEPDPAVDEAGKPLANGARDAARLLLDSAHEAGEEEVPQGKGVS